MLWNTKNTNDRTYIFIGDAHEAAIEADVLVGDVNSSLVSYLAYYIAEASEHFVCALLWWCRLFVCIIHPKIRL